MVENRSRGLGFNRVACNPYADFALYHKSGCMGDSAPVPLDSGDCERHTKGGKEKAESNGRFPSESVKCRKEKAIVKMPIGGDMPLSALK